MSRDVVTAMAVEAAAMAVAGWAASVPSCLWRMQERLHLWTF